MPETDTDRSTESREISSSGPDQANRSERGDLSPGPSDSGGGGKGDQPLETGTSAAGQTSAELGPNGDDSRRLSSPDASAQGAGGEPRSEDGLASPASHPEANESLASKPEANQSPVSPPEATESLASKPEANQSLASQPEPNQSRASQPEANQSLASKPEANEDSKPEASPASKPEANQAAKPEANQAAKREADQGSKTDGKSSESQSKAEVSDPKTLNKDQITEIARHSGSPDQLKLDLGLGPVTDKALGEYLVSKGFSLPGSMQHEPAGKYDGPSIGPDTHHTETRNIVVTNPDGSTSKIQMSGSPEALDRIQENANWQATRQMVEGLSSAFGETGAARSKGAETYRGEGTPGSGRRW